jgi:hypothetical protein
LASYWKYQISAELFPIKMNILKMERR